MLFDPRQTKQAAPAETKSHNIRSFADFLRDGGHHDLSAFAAIQLYEQAMPLFNAVDMRARHYSQIPIRLFDKSSDEFIDDHPVLTLLNNPNSDVSGNELEYAYATFFDIVGDSFLLATGRVENPPLELMVVPPQSITFGTGIKFGILHVPDWIQVTTAATGIAEMYFAEEVKEQDGQTTIRYYNKNRDSELWHSRLFSPRRSGANFWGMSRAQPIWLEIQQYLSGNNNNLSILKRGTRLSLAWVNNRGEELTDTQWNRLQEEANKYAGDTNAGGTPILDGMDIKTIQATNRDMEFKDLQEAMLARISTVYGIPLAMLLDKSMTMNNLETSGLQLHDNAVLPLTTYLHAELSRFLLPQYPDTADMEFCFSEGDIPALRPRVLENAKRQNDLNVNTMNEIRTLIGDEALESGGDVILAPANLIPVGQDAFTDDNLDHPEARSKFVDLMRECKGADGQRRYTDDDIKNIAESKGLSCL